MPSVDRATVSLSSVGVDVVEAASLEEEDALLLLLLLGANWPMTEGQREGWNSWTTRV